MSRELNFDSNKQEALAGNLDTNIKIIEKELDVKLDMKSDKIIRLWQKDASKHYQYLLIHKNHLAKRIYIIPSI